MLGTRKTAKSKKLFEKLPFDSDSVSNLFSSGRFSSSNSLNSNMSDSPAPISISDNTNPFAGEIKIGDKVGNSLFVKATKGLPDEEKLDFSIDNAQVFKSEMDTANANFVWGSVTFSINDENGTSQDLMEDFDKLKYSDVL